MICRYKLGKPVVLACGFAAAALVSPVPAAAQDTLRAVLSARLGVLDPVATTSYATRDFGYAVYDTLVSLGADGIYYPQMLDRWETSEDGLTYTFILRDGLRFSDGSPVVAEDAVASIRRWWARDSLGKRLEAATASLDVVDDKTFTLVLSRAFGHVIDALGKPSSNIPVIMPARLAANTPPNEAVAEVIGSGPFVFSSADWQPGNIARLERNPHYVPRAEPSNGLAGGKVVNIDRLEFVTIPDAATLMAALQAGEIDYVQSTPHDFVPILDADPSVQVKHFTGEAATIGAVVVNHLNPPFDNKGVRRALQALAIQPQYMAALGLSPAQIRENCISMFMCDTTYGSDAGADILPEASVENARRLLQEAGYNNEPVRIILATDVNDINLMGLVLEALMREAGFNVIVAPSDWPTVAQARWNKATVEEGGWSLMPLTWAGYDLASPFTNYRIASNCAEGYPGWSCVEEISELVAKFEAEENMEERKALMRRVQELAHDDVKYLVLGQYSRSESFRANLSGFPDVGIPVFWNVARSAN